MKKTIIRTILVVLWDWRARHRFWQMVLAGSIDLLEFYQTMTNATVQLSQSYGDVAMREMADGAASCRHFLIGYFLDFKRSHGAIDFPPCLAAGFGRVRHSVGSQELRHVHVPGPAQIRIKSGSDAVELVFLAGHGRLASSGSPILTSATIDCKVKI